MEQKLELLQTLGNQKKLTKEEVKTLQKLAMEAAFYDDLTGAYNRRYFKLLLSQCLQKEEPFALAMINIDEFKRFNDQYGQELGDQIISHLGQIIQILASERGMIARTGTQEFGLLLTGNSFESCEKMINVIRERVSETPLLFDPEGDGNEKELLYTVSCGLLHVARNRMPVINLLSMADGLVFKSKKEGRNRVSALSI